MALEFLSQKIGVCDCVDGGRRDSRALAQIGFVGARELVKGMSCINYQEALQCWSGTIHWKGDRAKIEAIIQGEICNSGHYGRFYSVKHLNKKENEALKWETCYCFIYLGRGQPRTKGWKLLQEGRIGFYC